MTDTETPEGEGPEAEASEEGGGAVAVATEAPSAAPPAVPAASAVAERPSHLDFWHRPMVERYFTPFVLPLLVVIGIVVYILNISRLFLAAHGNADVVAGTVITVIILVGATVLASVSEMRTASIVLIVAGLLGALTIAGSLSLGHSEVQGEAAGSALPPEGPALAEFASDAGPGNSLRFEPADGTVPTGIVRVSLKGVTGEHTLNFDDPKTKFEGLRVTGPGVDDSARAFFGEPADYSFYCAIPGHRDAGMVGVLHATGDLKTLEAAEAEAESAGGGETATTAAGG